MVADALLRLYLNDLPGTQCARSEFTYHDVMDDDTSHVEDVALILAGIEAKVATRCSVRVCHPTKKALAGEELESSVDFASCLKDHFVLRGPAEQKEGRSTDDTRDNENNVPIDNDRILTPTAVRTNSDLAVTGAARTLLLSQSSLGINISREV